MWKPEDRRMMKVIIIMRHALYMECMIVMVVVCEKYKNDRINYV